MATEFMEHLMQLYEKYTPTFLLANGWPPEVPGAKGSRGQGPLSTSPLCRNPATPHTSVWKHMPTTVLRGAPSQATSSVYRSSGHPAHELLLMWARWLCGSGSALMWAHPHTAPNPLTACIASQACMIHRLALSHQCRPLSVVQTQPLLLFTQRWCRALISVPTWESQP